MSQESRRDGGRLPAAWGVRRGALQETHSHVALGGGEGFGGQHVCLHQIENVDPVHPHPSVPKSEHEQPLLNVALVEVGTG